jgi:parvulin-like peptidyl-prolyl isomerase
MTQSRSQSNVVTRKGRRWPRVILGSILLVALCATIRYYWGAAPVSAEPADDAPAERPSAAIREAAPPAPVSGARESAEPSVPSVAAAVNGQRIARQELAQQCRREFGVIVLESMVNRQLIANECRRLGISVTRADVDAEIERLAKHFGIPVDQYLKMLKQERNVSPEHYADDIVWPKLAMRKIAGEQLTVPREELVRAFETKYGEAVRVRLIAVSSVEKARKLQAQAVANPSDFGNLAKQYSEDTYSASVKGLINPIRKHGSFKEIEDAVFNMADGEVSPVIHANGQYLILKRESLQPARPVKFEQVASSLEEAIRDRKMYSMAEELFQQLQKGARVENIWNDPVKQKQMPGVAATINGTPITIDELDEQCVARYGQEVIDAMVSRKLIEQDCQKQNVTVTDAEFNAEIDREAMLNVKPKPDGSPDIEAWLSVVTKQKGIPLEAYRRHMVWPAAALRKLVIGKVEVTEDDLRKGYEANYGPRVRCLAIVMNNQRRAQQVFELARKNNTSEAFGELASQYSIEPGSQAMHGEVPPIKRYGGQPILEEEAFQLKPGEISGVIQVGDKYVILRCEGYTKSANVDFATVRNDIYEDLHEKKVHSAMTKHFEEIREASTIDNYLAGTSHSPKEQHAGVSAAHNPPPFRQVPAN